ncbi:unnamed protein product [Microthlaspi erraticum]|uniref:F-box domain-containing protein n=1 Tax=Microthlaspi erraticum TaxID=1685480 RepID=A0A6D2IYJ4_9BRAS|nr:unnamed protein product [Microthlaspi erraticum]
MVGRNTQTLICEQGSSQGSQEKDVISQLPDHLITDILYHLPTKEAVTTSVLSTRWTNLWKLVPGLDLDSPRSSDFKAMQSFADRFLDIQRESLIRKFKLKIHCPDYGNDATCVPLWIEAALTGHRIQHLDVHYGYYLRLIPLSVFTSGRLVHLRLYGAKLFNAELVSLHCLKIIHLKYVTAPNEATFEKLISSSPVLEDLTIIMCSNKAKVLQVRSKTVRFNPSFKMIIYSGFSAKVDVDVEFSCSFNLYDSSDKRAVRDFLTVISSVRDLSLSMYILEVMYRHSEVKQLPQFGLLSRLCVSLCASDFVWLPTFLKNCPKLKFLSLVVWYGSCKKMPIDESFPPVLECLLSSLEFLDIKARVLGDSTEMKLVKYLLENSLILKKLTVRLDSHSRNDDISEEISHSRNDDISEEILRLPRRSITCQVLVL